MPTSSEKPTGADLSAILEGLIEAGVEFILVGGLFVLPPAGDGVL